MSDKKKKRTEQIPAQLTWRLHLLLDPDGNTLVKTNVLLSLMAWASIYKGNLWRDVERVHFVRWFDRQLKLAKEKSPDPPKPEDITKDVAALWPTMNFKSLSSFVTNVWPWRFICEEYTKDAERSAMLYEVSDFYFRLQYTPDTSQSLGHAYDIYAPPKANGKKKEDKKGKTIWNKCKGKWTNKVVMLWAFRQAGISLFEQFEKFDSLTKEERQRLYNQKSLETHRRYRRPPVDLYNPLYKNHVTHEQVVEVLELARWALSVWDPRTSEAEFFREFEPPPFKKPSLVPIPRDQLWK